MSDQNEIPADGRILDRKKDYRQMPSRQQMLMASVFSEKEFVFKINQMRDQANELISILASIRDDDQTAITKKMSEVAKWALEIDKMNDELQQSLQRQVRP